MRRTFDVDRYRARFPALLRQERGRPVVFLDGPGGSQVPDRVIEAVSGYLSRTNANTHGAFATSRESDAVLEEAHAAAADLVGTRDPGCVVFGANMTTLTLALARALSRTWAPGDEVLVTRLDHDANVAPWLQAAADAGATVRHVSFRAADCTLDLDDFRAQLGPRTRLVALGCASNAVGTINPVRELVREAHAVGALVFLDAVHYAPHGLIDVEAWDCDFLCCSAYKFFGPHVGILYGRRTLLESLPAYKVRAAPDSLPHRWETGTQCHEGIAGMLAAIEYLADLGRDHDAEATGRRAALVAAFGAIRAHEVGLSAHAADVLEAVPALRLYGITDRTRFTERTPTFSFTHAHRGPGALAAHLAHRGIYAWHGNFYALALTEALGLEPHGLLRVGLLHYNTRAEIDRLGDALDELD